MDRNRSIADLIDLHQNLHILFIWIECAVLVRLGLWIKKPLPIVVGVGMFLLIEGILLFWWRKEGKEKNEKRLK